jgi:hypothetical protein
MQKPTGANCGPRNQRDSCFNQLHGISLGSRCQYAEGMPMPDVKCVECGYIEVRDRDSYEVHEVPEFTRATGQYKGRSGNLTNARLLCAKASPAFLPVEMPAIIHSGTPHGKDHPNVKMLNECRDCGSFMKWIPGKSPKEHEAMSLLERVESLNAKARQEDIARHEMWNRRNFQWMVVAAGASLISALAAIVTYFLAFVRH